MYGFAVMAVNIHFVVPGNIGIRDAVFTAYKLIICRNLVVTAVNIDFIGGNGFRIKINADITRFHRVWSGD